MGPFDKPSNRSLYFLLSIGPRVHVRRVFGAQEIAGVYINIYSSRTVLICVKNKNLSSCIRAACCLDDLSFFTKILHPNNSFLFIINYYCCVDGLNRGEIFYRLSAAFSCCSLSYLSSRRFSRDVPVIIKYILFYWIP